ncbi:MAG: DUF2141 domain-containing protein [Bacteroidota bacterium]
MKLFPLLIVLLSQWNVSFAQLEVTVGGIKNDQGNIHIGVFKDKETFLKKAAYGKVVKAQKDQITTAIELPPGTYAVSVIHDENKNGELDTKIFGIPKEGFGFANDAMSSFGPPSFEKATITVEKGKRTITITLRYL